MFVCMFVVRLIVRSVWFVCLFFCLFACLFAAAQVGALQMIGLTPVRVLEALQARPRAASIGRACACARNGLSSVWRAPRSLTPTPAAAGVCRGDGRAAAPGSVHRTGGVGLGRSGEVGDVCEGLSGKALSGEALSGTAAKRESATRESAMREGAKRESAKREGAYHVLATLRSADQLTENLIRIGRNGSAPWAGRAGRCTIVAI